MTEITKQPELKAAIETFMPKVARRLHAWVKVEKDGKPSLACVWNEAGAHTFKEVVYVGDGPGFDAKTVASSLNKAMNATEQVIQMLLDLYVSHNGEPVGEGVQF